MPTTASHIQAARKVAGLGRFGPDLIRDAIHRLAKGDADSADAAASLAVILIAAAKPPELGLEQVAEEALLK